MATNSDFQARVQSQLYKAAVVVLNTGAPTYEAVQIAAAKRILNGYVLIQPFCLALCNDTTFGPLVDAAATEGDLTDNQIMTGCVATVDVFAAGQI
jgi:hypothetical protein